MKKVSSLNPLQPIVYFFDRFNLVSFIVIVAAGLIGAILILTNILMKPHDSAASPNVNSSTTNNTTFDQLTTSRLLKLENSSTNSSYKSLPSGRNNPFSE